MRIKIEEEPKAAIISKRQNCIFESRDGNADMSKTINLDEKAIRQQICGITKFPDKPLEIITGQEKKIPTREN